MVSRLKVEKASPTLPGSIMSAFELLMNPVVGTLWEWLNENIRLEEGRREIIDDVTFYRFLSCYLFSQSSGISVEEPIALLNSLWFKIPSERVSSKIWNK